MSLSDHPKHAAKHATTGDQRRYGAGLPQIGSRRLAPHEVQSIQRAVRSALAQTGLMAATVVLSVAVALVYRNAPEGGLAAQLGGPAGVGIFVAGFVGAFGAVVAGRRSWKWSAAIGLLYMMGVAGLSAVDPAPASTGPGYLTWAVALSTVVIGFGFCASRLSVHARVLVRLRRVKADLAARAVEQFEGRLRPATIDRALARLLPRPGRRAVSTAQHHRVEMLPTSGVIVRVDGHLPADLDVAHLADVAVAQPHAFRAPLPEGLAAPHGARVHLQRRSLTIAERDELEAHIRRLRRRHWQVGAVGLATVVAMAWQFQTAGGAAGLLTAPCLAWYLFTALTCVGYARRVRAAGRLESDRDLRWVVTVDSGEREGADTPPKLEVLPVSQLAWTEDAAPASWRTVRL